MSKREIKSKISEILKQGTKFKVKWHIYKRSLELTTKGCNKFTVELCTTLKIDENRFRKTLEFKQLEVVNLTLHREPVLKFLNKNSRVENGVICHLASTYNSSNSFKISC